MSCVLGRLDDRVVVLVAEYRSMLQCIVTWRSSILEDLPHQAVPAIAREVCAAYTATPTPFWAPAWDGKISWRISERISQQTSPLNFLFCPRHAEAIQVLNAYACTVLYLLRISTFL